MQQRRLPFRLRLAKAIAGSRAKDFIPSLDLIDRWRDGDGSVLKGYRSKSEQIAANLNWSYAANRAIVEPAAAIELKVYRKDSKGERKEATDAKARQLLELLSNPNNVHTWEQMAQLHYTYLNFNGESYTMMFCRGEP